VEREVFAKDDPVPGFAGAVRIGGLVFTSGVDGHRDPKTNAVDPKTADKVEEQCERSYGKAIALLEAGGSSAANAVRVDHWTASQEWLPRRAAIRSRLFGKPATLGSTGVASKMSGINLVTTALVGVTAARDKAVLVTGAAYGMPNISSVVRGGPFLFLSGARATLHPRGEVPEETPAAFGVQARLTYEIVRDMLADVKAKPAAHALRFDVYIRDRRCVDEDRVVRAGTFGKVEAVASTFALPLGMRGEIEATTIALAPDSGRKEVRARDHRGDAAVVAGGDLLFVGECLGAVNPRTGATEGVLADDADGQVRRAFDTLEARLAAGGAGLDRLVRLDAYLRDPYQRERFLDRARQRLGTTRPALALAGAELEGINEVKLCAIAAS
jgi:enamine deaminase RidA (YjgF/YER057c/UK114 family)